MQQRLTLVATIKLPLMAHQVASLLVGIEALFPGAHVQSVDDELGVYAPTVAVLQILDDDLDNDDLDELDDDDPEETEIS